MADVIIERRQPDLPAAPASQAEQRYLQLDSARLFYQVAGAGPPVVLVHGLSVSSAYFVRPGEQLAGDYPVFAPGLPGFGGSQKPPHGLGLDELTEVLHAWLDIIGLARPVLVGNSAGCQIITLLAARYPDCATGLVLLGPSVDRRRRSVWQQGLRLLLDAAREPAL